MKKLIKNKRFCIVAAAAVIILVIVIKSVSLFKKGETKIITSSTLKEAINISTLSTAQFTYNGIAEVYKDEKEDKIKCHIRYNATVKAGIDMDLVEFQIDKSNKTIEPILPEINIASNIVDEQSLSFIPEDKEIDLKDALTVCQKDALSEAQESPELLRAAEDNLKAIIEALTYPVISPQGYKIIWNEKQEGGDEEE